MPALAQTALRIALAWASSDSARRIIRQAVAWLLNWAAQRYLIDKGKGRDVEVWAQLARETAEAAAVFAAAVEDGVITDDEALECQQALREVLAAWSDARPTPETYKARAR